MGDDEDLTEFSEWYHRMLEENEVVDTRYPVKGMPVYRGYGMKIIRVMQRFLEDLLEEDGHDPMLFPVAIPEDLLAKETEHIAGFEDEVYWITHAGANQLERKMALRPTSETCMYPMFALWTRTHADLPIKIHQTVCVYRYETKHTRPLIRSREIAWNEGHTAFATREGALENIETIKGIYGRLINELLCIPVQVNQRPDWDKFPGAEYTIAFETIMPDGRTMQLATIHNLGQHFSKVFDLSYDDEDGKKHHAWQTSYGPGFGRLLAAVISVHGDEKGLALPPKVAPIQVVVVPILFKETGRDEVMAYVGKIEDKLRKSGVRYVVDRGGERPGDKFFKWEKKGVPLRIEAGPRDMKEGKVVVVRRDNGEKKSVGLTELDLNQALDDVQDSMRYAAQKKFDERLYEAETMDDVRENMGKGIITTGWCGDKECAKPIESISTILSMSDDEMECAKCGAKGKKIKVAKTY
ncbi:MAG: proline--tRNA ligase [Candidatus Altiarchaeota archaeon]